MADAIPQLAGQLQPGGSVLYTCSGLNEHGKKCGKLMFVWMPPAQPEAVGHPGAVAKHGRVEVKCRRCKTLCYVELDTVVD
jgi:hypothetical protein